MEITQTNKVHTVWNSKGDLSKYEDFLADEYPELTTDDEKYEAIQDLVNMSFVDDMLKLTRSMPATMICIATLDISGQKKPAYKLIDNHNLASCFSFATIGSDCTSADWYVDQNEDFKAIGYHDDGTNHYIFRMWKPWMPVSEMQEFCDRIVNGQLTENDINSCTEPIGKVVNNIYGW